MAKYSCIESRWTLVLCCLAAVLLGGPPGTRADTEKADIDRIEKESAYEEIELFTEALLVARKYYVDEKSYKQLVYGALEGMLASLDAHCAFMEPEEIDEMREDTSGKYSGIGIHIGMRDNLLTVIAPIEDTPAYKAGVLSGDRIVNINGEKTMGMSLKDAIKRLRGEANTTVKIRVRRQDKEEPLEFAIVRQNIDVPSVKGTSIIRGGVGYVRIVQFSEPTAQSLQAALDKLTADGMKALVLDLRNNPGGLLKSAVDVAEKFLAKGTLVVTTKGREFMPKDVANRAGGSTHYTDFPVAVLINGGSASASEIVSGALRDNGRAVLVGETTFGKGSVQTVLRLSEDKETALRLTTALYYTPGGRQINNKGIDPDIPVYLTPEEWRRILIRRLHLENPQLYSDKEKAEYSEVVDRPLERAVDLLEAICAYNTAAKR